MSAVQVPDERLFECLKQSRKLWIWFLAAVKRVFLSLLSLLILKVDEPGRSWKIQQRIPT